MELRLRLQQKAHSSFPDFMCVCIVLRIDSKAIYYGGKRIRVCDWTTSARLALGYMRELLDPLFPFKH